MTNSLNLKTYANQIPKLSDLATAALIANYDTNSFSFIENHMLLNSWEKFRKEMQDAGSGEVVREIEIQTLQALAFQGINKDLKEALVDHTHQFFLVWAERFKDRLNQPVSADLVSYARYQESLEAHALEQIWRALPAQIKNVLALPHDLNAIQQFFDDPNQQVLLDTITELNLSNCEMQVLPPQLKKFTQLRKLNLKGNRLTNLPPFLSQLCHLKEIDLSENRLAVFPKLPPLGALTFLNLENNRITYVPDFQECPHLIFLNLNHNRIRRIANFSYLPHLEELFIENNRLIEVPDLRYFRNLKKASFSHNSLKTVPNFGNLPHLTCLGLSHNFLKSIPNFDRMPNLVVLDLSHNNLLSDPILIHCPQLVLLKVHENPFKRDEDRQERCAALVVGAAGILMMSTALLYQTLTGVPLASLL